MHTSILATPCLKYQVAQDFVEPYQSLFEAKLMLRGILLQDAVNAFSQGADDRAGQRQLHVK